MNNIELYLKALTRVYDRHAEEQTSHRGDWAALGGIYAKWLTGSVSEREARAVFINIK